MNSLCLMLALLSPVVPTESVSTHSREELPTVLGFHGRASIENPVRSHRVILPASAVPDRQERRLTQPVSTQFCEAFSKERVHPSQSSTNEFCFQISTLRAAIRRLSNLNTSRKSANGAANQRSINRAAIRRSNRLAAKRRFTLNSIPEDSVPRYIPRWKSQDRSSSNVSGHCFPHASF